MNVNTRLKSLMDMRLDMTQLLPTSHRSHTWCSSKLFCGRQPVSHRTNLRLAGAPSEIRPRMNMSKALHHPSSGCTIWIPESVLVALNVVPRNYTDLDTGSSCSIGLWGTGKLLLFSMTMWDTKSHDKIS
jgi:hypothetical protein